MAMNNNKESSAEFGGSLPLMCNKKEVIALDNIGVNFNGIHVLRNVNLTVYSGEFVCLLGQSGVGKTTLLRVLAGLQKPSDGYYRIQDMAPRIALVAQNPTLLPWRTVLANVVSAINQSDLHKEGKIQIAKEILDKVGLIDKYSLYPKELSGGMQQRVAIARALASKPDVILMDEPFSALDENLRKYLGEFLLKLWKEENLTIVFNTHSIDEAAVLGTQVLVLRKGEKTTDVKIINQWNKNDINFTERLKSKNYTLYKDIIREALSI